MTHDERLRAAADAWAAAFRARQAARSVKRRVQEAMKQPRPALWSDDAPWWAERGAQREAEREAERNADARLTHARVEFRTAEHALLQIVDPKPITLKARTREVKPGPTLAIDHVTDVTPKGQTS